MFPNEPDDGLIKDDLGAQDIWTLHFLFTIECLTNLLKNKNNGTKNSAR